MCVDPRTLANGSRVPCHQCWQCRENRINDWVGRCIAERETSVACSVVTLTYGGGDTPQSRFLRKSDLAAFTKTVRNEGHKVRHFAVGEYGSKKGRAHWHVVQFWQTPMPHREMRKNVEDELWPHGLVYWDEARADSIRYVMKYINKDIRDGAADKALSMSKKPMLGSNYFWELAGRYVEQGLSPQKPFYKFRDVYDRDGQPQQYYMPPLVAERFICMFIARWRDANPDRHWPASDLVDQIDDKLSRFARPLRFEPRRYREGPWMLPPNGGAALFDERLNSHYCVVDGQKLFWSFDERGQRAWHEKIVTEKEAERRQAVFGVWKASAE